MSRVFFFFAFFVVYFYVYPYLFVTLRRPHFSLDSDLEVEEALREDSLRLLAICSWQVLNPGNKYRGVNL